MIEYGNDSSGVRSQTLALCGFQDGDVLPCRLEELRHGAIVSEVQHFDCLHLRHVVGRGVVSEALRALVDDD